MAQDAAQLQHRVKHHYLVHFDEPRRERLFLSALGFGGGALVTRAVTHLIRRNIGPFRNISVGGSHVHHLVPGILTLLLTGYTWLVIADDAELSRRAHRFTAVAYGLGAALTLDEFALWVSLSDVYWDEAGRKSVQAVMLFGAILSAGIWGGPFIKAVSQETAALIRVRASKAVAQGQ
jgi:hypothetical protein